MFCPKRNTKKMQTQQKLVLIFLSGLIGLLYGEITESSNEDSSGYTISLRNGSAAQLTHASGRSITYLALFMTCATVAILTFNIIYESSVNLLQKINQRRFYETLNFLRSKDKGKNMFENKDVQDEISNYFQLGKMA